MKGIEPLIAAILIIAISLTAIVIVLQYSTLPTNRAKELLLLQEGKKNMNLIDSSIKQVVQEGNGSTRSLTLSITDGSYLINATNDTILFSMLSTAQVIGVGVSSIENNINITGYQGKVILMLNYSTIDITDGGSFGIGTFTIIIKNNGLNQTSGKQLISVKPL